MKYILFILSFFITTEVFSQNLVPPRTTAGTTVQDNRLKIPMNFVPPSGPTPTLNGGLTLAGGLFYSTADTSLYTYDSLHAKFQRILKLSDTGYLKSLTPAPIWGNIQGNILSQTDLQTQFGTKQNTITLGTTAQYFRGNLTLATFPTTVSTFTNDAGYLTNTTGDARYPQLSGSYANPSWITSLAWSKITGTPTTLSGYGITDAVPAARTLTINGITQDLSANRTWTIPAATPGGSTGSVQYRGSTGAFTGDGHFVWDSTNNILNVGNYSSSSNGTIIVGGSGSGIGNITGGGGVLNVIGGGLTLGTTGATNITFRPNSNTTFAINSNGAFLANGTDAGTSGYLFQSNGTGGSPTWVNGAGVFWQLGGNSVASLQNLGTTANFSLPFIVNNIERGRIENSAGNWLLGTTTNGVGKLQVVGAAGTILAAQSTFAGTPTLTYDALADSTTVLKIRSNTTTGFKGASVETGQFASSTYSSGIRWGAVSFAAGNWGIEWLGSGNGNCYINMSLIPFATNTRDFGTSGFFWRNGFVNGITMGSTGVLNGTFTTSSMANTAGFTRSFAMTSPVSSLSGSLTGENALLALTKVVDRGAGNSGMETGIKIIYTLTSGLKTDWRAFHAPDGDISGGYGTLRGGAIIWGVDAISKAPSAILQLEDTIRGVLLPRMTSVRKNNISSPATGLLVYQTDGISGLQYYDGANWVRFGSENRSFIQGGNAFGAVGTLGTTDANALNLITNNTVKLSIGTTIPDGASTDSILVINATALKKVASNQATKFTVNTTDATVTTISTIPIPTGKVIEIEYTISGKDASNNVAIYRRLLRAQNVAGTVTILNGGVAQGIGTDGIAVALATAAVSESVSSTNVLVRVAGVAATNITWEDIQGSPRQFF